MKAYWDKWQQFWFSPQDLFRPALFRFCFSFVLLIMYSLRAFEFKIFFSEQGLFSIKSLESYVPSLLKPPMFLFTSSDGLNQFLYILLLVCILLMLLGLANRAVTILTFLLHLIFIQRNPAIIYGADLVSTFWLFYLCFVSHNQYFTLRKWLPFYKRFKSQGDIFNSVGIRLIQIQLCIIYAYTGMEKLKGETWWDGSAVWYVMGNDNIVPFDFSFFQHMPWAVAAMTFSTLLFEIYFPIGIWMKSLRPLWMFLGLCLHGLAMIFMGLSFFSPIMLSSYILFLDPVLLQKFFWTLETPSTNVKIYWSLMRRLNFFVAQGSVRYRAVPWLVEPRFSALPAGHLH